jgi:hypothetical protein
MKKNVIFLFFASLAIFSSCSDDDNTTNTANSVAFVNSIVNLNAAETTVSVVFEKPTSSSGSLTISVNPTNAVYGTDFTTNPSIESNVLTIPYSKNISNATFTFNRLIEGVEGQIKNVEFTIMNTSDENLIISSTSKTTKLNFDETPIETATVSPTVGGANVINQVYVDLSSGIGTPVNRASWDLGFYSGDDFRVAINGSIKMAIKQINSTDITQNVEIDNTVAVGEGGGTGIVNGNPTYVDNPNGDISQTAIASVSTILSDNKVYLVNLGHAVATVAPNTGSVNAYGDHRGWRKIRVLRNGNDYKLQYALPDSSTFNEVTISKNAAFNFTFFSFNSNAVVTAEPEKAKWDLNFTSFTNLTNFGTGNVSYAYQDFIVTNSKGGTRAYEVLNSAGVTYSNFTSANIDNTKLNQAEFQDQRNIGSNWRNGGGPTTLPSAKDDRFYVLKDASGNTFKIRFISLTNAAGERGNPTFEYEKLN